MVHYHTVLPAKGIATVRFIGNRTRVHVAMTHVELAVTHRTGISVGELLSNAARQWYDLEGDAPRFSSQVGDRRG